MPTPTDAAAYCGRCEQTHHEGDLCQFDRAGLYRDLQYIVGQLAPETDRTGKTDRVWLISLAQQRLGRLLQLDACDQRAELAARPGHAPVVAIVRAR